MSRSGSNHYENALIIVAPLIGVYIGAWLESGDRPRIIHILANWRRWL